MILARLSLHHHDQGQHPGTFPDGSDGEAPVAGQDGTIYFGNHGSFPGGYTGALIALTAGGELKWRFGIVSNGHIWASPAVGSDGTVYFTCANGNLYAVRSDGTLRWVHPTSGDTETKSAPVVGPDGTVYFGAGSVGHYYVVDPDGTRKWDSGFVSTRADCTPVVAQDGSVFVVGHYYWYRFHGQTGVALDQSPRLTPQIAVGGALLTPDGWLYYGKDDNILRAYQVGIGPSLTSAWPMDHGDFRRAGMRGCFGGQPICGSMQYETNEVGVAVYGTPGKRYEVRASTDLKTWTSTIATDLTSSNGVVFATDIMLPAPSHRFYRGVEQ